MLLQLKLLKMKPIWDYLNFYRCKKLTCLQARTLAEAGELKIQGLIKNIKILKK